MEPAPEVCAALSVTDLPAVATVNVASSLTPARTFVLSWTVTPAVSDSTVTSPAFAWTKPFTVSPARGAVAALSETSTAPFASSLTSSAVATTVPSTEIAPFTASSLIASAAAPLLPASTSAVSRTVMLLPATTETFLAAWTVASSFTVTEAVAAAAPAEISTLPVWAFTRPFVVSV